ncbi:MAG: hypothetical protein ACKD6O_08100 [Candidatus Bathyarchaeota archaeon]
MKAYIITKDRKVKRLNVDARGKYFFYDGNAYVIDGEAVKMHFKTEKPNPTAECFYIEGCAVPLDSNMNSNDVLNEAVLRNALETLSDVKEGFRFNVEHFWKLFVVLFVVGVLLWGLLHG